MEHTNRITKVIILIVLAILILLCLSYFYSTNKKATEAPPDTGLSAEERMRIIAELGTTSKTTANDRIKIINSLNESSKTSGQVGLTPDQRQALIDKLNQ